MIRNKLSEHKTITEKERAYISASTKSNTLVMAYTSDGAPIPLVNVDVSQVEFVSGTWCIQNTFPYKKIYQVRDREFVLCERLPRQENNHFEFHSALPVSWNCFGPFVIKDQRTQYVVAKYKTKQGTYWSYGRTIEEARAFLGIKLYDEYKDLIHSVACKKCNVRNSK